LALESKQLSGATTIDEWADRYGKLRRGGPGNVSAWLGIPLIVGSLIGILWSAPVPPVLSDASPAINFATLFLMATFVYYCILSISLGFAGFLFLLVLTAPSIWLTQTGLPLAPISSSLFVVTLAWQLGDTKIATGRLCVVQNLQYLMIGPIWILRAAYRKLGLAY
jgi:uncharacterized membrane protein YGL010W